MRRQKEKNKHMQNLMEQIVPGLVIYAVYDSLISVADYILNKRK